MKHPGLLGIQTPERKPKNQKSEAAFSPQGASSPKRLSVLHYQLPEISNSLKAVLLHQKVIYSLKLMIWNNRLALVKNQFLLFGEGAG
jgi:hypothetical protein